MSNKQEPEFVPNPTCSNCGRTLGRKDKFCPNCGQRVIPRKVPLWDLFYELGEAFFNVDNKIFQTLKTLVFPGRLTVLFFDGKRKRFVHPARLFLVTAILFLAVLNFSMLREVRSLFGASEETLSQRAHEDLFRERVVVVYDSLKQERPDNTAWQSALDSLMKGVGRPRRDSFNFGYLSWVPNRGFEPKQVRFDVAEMYNLSPDTLLEKYQVEGFPGRMIVRQSVRVAQNQTDFWKFALGQVTWMLLLMMPAIALLMKLLYIRRNRFFIEHLYFNFHTHAFVFLLYSLALLIDDPLEIAVSTASLATIIYIYMAMLTYYKQGWFKTLLKYFIIGMAYGIISVIFAVFTFLISGLAYS